ncbi:ubiquinol-cytochrome-c reductase complex assembly factor 3 [Anarhichas minor]|uniref:ubiquinol-cytochrome-c reductase complex assembly factor 3 n=1 Tax=Anarhichas minor TaxID=65739 RepID=UPI003F740E17
MCPHHVTPPHSSQQVALYTGLRLKVKKKTAIPGCTAAAVSDITKLNRRDAASGLCLWPLIKTQISGRYCVSITRSRMSAMRTILSSGALVALLGLGYGMWAIISPGEERRRELLKNLPESNPMRMEETRKRNVLVMQALKDAAETNNNIARGVGGPAK